MEQLKAIKEQLIAQVQGQMADLRCVDTHELGEVIDMIKDIAKAEYYCEIYEQMKEQGAEQPTNNNYYYTERYYPTPDYYRDMDRYYGRMYYPEGGNSSQSGSNNNNSQGNNQYSSSGSNMNGGKYYTEPDYRSKPYIRSEEFYEKEFPMQYLRDEREGRSPMKRKMYMESKSTGQDSSKSIKELESYMQDLTSDMMELLDKASPEEKAMIQKKVNTLASKVQNV